jgi:hypothetical protein
MEKEATKETWRNIPAYEKFLPFFCTVTGAEERGEKDPTVLQSLLEGRDPVRERHVKAAKRLQFP